MDDYVSEHIFSFTGILEKNKMKQVCKRWKLIIGTLTIGDLEIKDLMKLKTDKL